MNLLDLIPELGNRKFFPDAQLALNAVCKAVAATGRQGKLTLSFVIEPGDGETLTIKPDITPKIPLRNLRDDSFFVDQDGCLSTEDPNQPEFPNMKQEEAS